MTNNLHSIVTGGVQGIGLAIAQQLKHRGDTVTIFDNVNESDERIQILKKDFVYYHVDIGSHASIQEGFKNFFSSLPESSRLNLLVNNAGITRDQLAIRVSEDNWDAVLNVNLKGLFFCAQQALKHMMTHKKGYIINMSSIVSLNGNAGQAHYSASKAGINALTKSLAQEYGARSIIINAIAPGFIKTAMTQKLSPLLQESILQRIALKRFGEGTDIANLVDFLSSGKADYITGHIFCVDGGLH